jgi:hypothetical protein
MLKARIVKPAQIAIARERLRKHQEKVERPPLEAATKQRLVKTVTENASLCVTVIYKM